MIKYRNVAVCWRTKIQLANHDLKVIFRKQYEEMITFTFFFLVMYRTWAEMDLYLTHLFKLYSDIQYRKYNYRNQGLQEVCIVTF